jgi:FixJ family two-component response regulator
MEHRILYIVDGDASARKGLARLFSVAGYDVEPFSSFEEFFQIRTINGNACLIVEIWLSGLSGSDLDAELSRRNILMPVIFLSARDDEESRDSARAAHAACFFRKPIDGPALLDAVAWILNMHER